VQVDTLGSKVMIHGGFPPQYQGYGEKILVGSYLKNNKMHKGLDGMKPSSHQNAAG